jgi:uncharacterized Ntn-hydrolase superfamily protein
MTYSIVALDPETGELGIGVQTHQLAVGALVPWVKGGVGAVATQSFTRASFGPQILALLENGMDAAQALDAVLVTDGAAVLRQVAVIDRAGRVAVHTGDACTAYAGHHCGQHYAVQANMMQRSTVPAAMAKAFEFSRGPLPVRILHALDAAEAEGGDLRGAQSAALIVRGDGSADDNRHWDFRVDHDPQPLARLRELLTLRMAIRLAQGRGRSTPTSTDPNQALADALSGYEQSQRLAPSDETTFWFAVQTLADDIGAIAQAATLLDALFQRAPQWRELLHRLPMLRTPELLQRFPRN